MPTTNPARAPARRLRSAVRSTLCLAHSLAARVHVHTAGAALRLGPVTLPETALSTPLDAEGTVFEDNVASAAAGGGAISVLCTSQKKITVVCKKCRFKGNTAGSPGSIIAVQRNASALANCDAFQWWVCARAAMRCAARERM